LLLASEYITSKKHVGTVSVACCALFGDDIAPSALRLVMGNMEGTRA